MLTSKVAVVKSHYGISVNWSRYQYTGPTDPSLGNIQFPSVSWNFAATSKLMHSRGAGWDSP